MAFKDRCVGGDWICGLEIKAEVGNRNTHFRVIYIEMIAEVLGRAKADKEGRLNNEEKPETYSKGMSILQQ